LQKRGSLYKKKKKKKKREWWGIGKRKGSCGKKIFKGALSSTSKLRRHERKHYKRGPSRYLSVEDSKKGHQKRRGLSESGKIKIAKK